MVMSHHRDNSPLKKISISKLTDQNPIFLQRKNFKIASLLIFDLISINQSVFIIQASDILIISQNVESLN